MNKKLCTALLLGWIPFSYAAEAVITGEGKVTSLPDYVELTITVDSLCYPSANDARMVNDEAARKIVDFLNAKIQKKDLYNTVISTGGFTVPYRYYYQDRFLCDNTFQKQNTIVFRTQDLKNFETLFDEIQNTVYQQFPRTPPAVIQSSISYVTMSMPMAGISNTLRSQLEQKALAMAFEDAKAKLAALFGKQKIQSVKVSHLSELPPDDEPKPRYAQEMAMGTAVMSARAAPKMDSAPVQFDQQEIQKTIYFTFTFDDVELTGNSSE